MASLLETWLEEKHWEQWEKRREKGSSLDGTFTLGNNTIRWKGHCQVKEWLIVAVYNAEGWEKLREELKDIGEHDNEQVLIVGDMNARIGEDKGVMAKDGREWERTSKDILTNGQKVKMLKWMEEEGLLVLNGWKQGDETGEWTYVAERGCTIIDYGIVNGNTEREVTKFSVGERIESDHMPLLIVIGKEEEEEGTKTILNKEERWKKYVWSEDGVKEYRKMLEGREWEKKKEESVQECWGRLRAAVDKARPKQKYQGRCGGKQASWWTVACFECRPRMRKSLWELRIARKREWESIRPKYLRERRRFREVCKVSKLIWKKKIEEEVKAIKTENDFWQFVNKGRKRRKVIRSTIAEEEWVHHFDLLLGGRRATRGYVERGK